MMNRNIENYYTMSVSYAMLLPALLQINEFLENRRLVNFVFYHCCNGHHSIWAAVRF